MWRWRTRYRVRRLMVGRETVYSLACSVTGAMGMIKGMLPGGTVEIVVQAVNGRSQGVASDPIQITIPGPVAGGTNTAPAPQQAEPMPAKQSSNGHTNGSRHAAPRS